VKFAPPKPRLNSGFAAYQSPTPVQEREEFTTESIIIQSSDGSKTLKASTISVFVDFLLFEEPPASCAKSFDESIASFAICHGMYCELGTQLKTMVQKIQSIANPAQKTKSALRLMMFMTTIVSRMPHLFEAGSQSLMIKLVEPFRFFSPEGFGELVSALAKSKRLYQPQTANLLGKDVGIESLIFAQQVTVGEWEFFTSIRVEEFYNLSWSKPALQHLAPNLCATIKWSNLFCTWVSSYVLAEKNTQKRATHLGQLIGLADNLLGMNNFNGAMEVYSGITKIAVYRLKQTWEKLPTKSTETFSKLEKVFSPEKNFAAYRAMLQNATPPCMPFLGIHLSDLTFTDEGIKGTVPSKLPKPDGTVESLINFDKWKKVGKILLDITQGRSINYTHKADHLLLTLKEDPLAFLLALTSTKKSESSLEELGTDESQMAQSLKIEPKVSFFFSFLSIFIFSFFCPFRLLRNLPPGHQPHN